VGKVLKAIVGIALVVFAAPVALALGSIGIAVGIGTVVAIGATLALSAVGSMIAGNGMPKSQLSRLNVTLDTTTPRKAVMGTTAMNLDLRYHEASGTNQEYIDYIIAVAAHKVKSIDEIWFEEKQAWTASGGVTSTYSGYLTIATRTEGTAGNTIAINGGSKWGSTCRLTGCAYVHLRIKRTGNSSKTESPLVNGMPSRVTIIGDGALLYDPRSDSTVSGGSGTHRSDDQSTWGSYTDADDTDNPALQLLWWLLGWKINGKTSIGCGVPPARIDLESFITAANICDETVLLATGGTQKRYRTSGTASDADDRMTIISSLLTCMNGTLRDSNGKLALEVVKNDLADYVLDFEDGDLLGEFEWQQTRGLTDTYNKARGRYIDPSSNSLYQLVDYPEVGFTSPDGIERAMSLDLPYVEDGRRAQRLAKQALQRNQYRGMFNAVFTAKAQGCVVGDIVRLSFGPLGWSQKLFRVVSQEIRFDGQVPMALIEEHPDIYKWDAEDSAPVTPTAPTIYDPLNNPFILGTLQASSRHEPADATSIFTANYQGILDSSQLPRAIQFKRLYGSTDASSSATWSIVSQSGVSGGTVTVSNGIVNIPSGATIASSAEIVVKSAYQGLDVTSRIAVARSDAPPPNLGGGSGSGTIVNDSTFNSVSGTTLTAISDLMTVKTGSAGTITFSAPLPIYADASSPYGEYGAVGRWKYRPVGGSFSDAGTLADDSYAAGVIDEGWVGFPYTYPGYIEISATVTGLSASTDYEVQLYAARDSASPTNTISFGGTASAVGS